MPPRKRIEATCYIVDCSSNVKERLQVLYKFHSLKYFSQTAGLYHDHQQVILYNHPGLKSKFVVNDWQPYAFDVLQSIKDTIENANEECKAHNFLYILHGALEAFDANIMEKEYIKRIVFITDLSSPMTFDFKVDGKINIIKRELIKNNVWLYVVGLDIKVQNLLNEFEISKLNKIEPVGKLTSAQKQNYDILKRFTRNVVYVDKEHGLDVVFAHKIMPKTPCNWYVNMNIGPDLQIPVVVYRTTRVHEPIKTHQFSPDEPQCSTPKSWYDINTHDKVKGSDAVQGKFATLSKEQIKNAKKDTKKCLTIFGFAAKDEVPIELYIMENSISSIKPDPRGRKSAQDRRFAFLATSLQIKNCVALAYRVYNDGNQRKFFALFPCPDHKLESHLLMGQLPYKHEFQERFSRGTTEIEHNSQTFRLMTEFLDNLTPVDEKTKRELYPLPPSMQVDRNRLRKAEYLLCKYLNEDPGEAPTLCMHPVIEERASKIAEKLLRKVSLN